MKKILLASHGKLASGIRSSIKILTGREKNLRVIDAYVDDSDFTGQIIDFIASIDANDQGFIFTDIYGGSVNQKVVSEVINSGKKNIYVITGMNLPIVLSILLATGNISMHNLQEMINDSQLKIVEVKVNKNKEDDFF
ncbi:PTS mannose transporter subunit IIA [Lactobacillus sp. ESL0731]|uniref:PTS sugar transporter subunit IIA n=1 Tax=unclassified Lactobacillus TaxID=2620435 RepID=UPI0023FA03D5|nr:MULTISPECIES: PTS mannose transporter subunit IIA [unclassified Lactobacillus]WEV51361.1 PTS mannose transporter subunit IIA [Lactobacillus sp. ESL0700]WEV62491.1 PTS mannose transporter subunit IIA [Lactobacillus sp. ESL0731]